jgi:hypothetical protein
MVLMLSSRLKQVCRIDSFGGLQLQRRKSICDCVLLSRDNSRHQGFLSAGTGEALVVNRWPGFDSDCGARFEDADEAAVLRRRIPARGSVSA